MKRSFEETKGIDIATHAQVCLKYFQLVITNKESEGVKFAISQIYQG